MKKIGIITFHSAHNYGAMLQAYALQNTIKKLNNEPYVINYRNNKIDSEYKVWNIKSKNPINVIKKTIGSIANYKINKERYNNFSSFMNKKLNLSKEYRDIKELKSNPPNYDIYITGSDQVWNPYIVGRLSDAYTLNFGDDVVKRISYAASMGSPNIEEKYADDYKNKISKINRISVRENDAKNYLSKIVNNPIDVVLDPTLLMTKQEWEVEIKDCKQINDKYILAYVVKEDEEYRKIVNYISQKTGLKVVHFEKEDNYDYILRSSYTDGPLEFVNLIKNAEYVVATSFHATVFSIIFNKKFYVIPHEKTGSRVTNLLDALEIENRVVYTSDEFKRKKYNEAIDYNKANQKLKYEREKSIEWLKSAIQY